MHCDLPSNSSTAKVAQRHFLFRRDPLANGDVARQLMARRQVSQRHDDIIAGNDLKRLVHG